MKQLQDDLSDFHGDESSEYFTIDKIRAVEIANSLSGLEDERDRLKDSIELLRIAAEDSNISIRYWKRSSEVANAFIAEMHRREQARDEALEKCEIALRSLSIHGCIVGANYDTKPLDEALRKIEAAKGEG